MSFHHTPIERPRQQKRFLTVRDVEDFAASGGRQIVHNSDLVITDAAREAASDLQIVIVSEEHAQTAAARPIVAGSTATALKARAPETVAASAGTSGTPNSQPYPSSCDNSLVQALVREVQAKWRPVKRHPRQLLA